MVWYIVGLAVTFIFGFLVGRVNGSKIDKVVDAKNDVIDKLK